MTDVDPRWYDGFFEAEWLDYLSLPRDHEVTLHQVDFVVEQVALEPGRAVLDVACGRGRHSVELARRGFRVTGIDLSEQRRHDQLGGRLEATWTFIRPDGSRSVLEHSLRAYTPAELRLVLERVGLVVERAWGSFNGTELGDGTRTILLARKPG